MSNIKKYIVMFWFHDDWGRFGRAYERIAEHLAAITEVKHVVCMFPPVSAKEFKLRDGLRVRSVSEKITLITEADYNRFRLNSHFTRLRTYLNNLYRTRVLSNQLRQLGFNAQNTILWLFPPHPYLERLIDIIPHRLVVSHVIDDFTKFDPNHACYRFAKEQYPKLGWRSDLIFTTSEANYKHFSKLIDSCYMFWPAVDKAFMGRPEFLPHRVTGDAPRLGYVGWIMERTDLELLEYVAIQRPQWRLILAGPQYPENILGYSKLLSLANVEYIGPLPQAEVPKFLQTLDVCLMPHRDTEYSRSMGPLKLYQYLASGRPVVSTKVAGLDRVCDYIHIASSYKKFIQLIEAALEKDTPEESALRIHIAQQNTWNIRVREMFDTVLDHFG